MVGQLDEVFYRNKRAALASSAVLIAANLLSLQVIENAPLYIFRLDKLSNIAILAIVLAVCVYLNVSYFVHYATEVPQWRRSPESGLQQAEAVRTKFEELRQWGIEQEETIRKTWEQVKASMGKLLKGLAQPIHVGFPKDLETRVQNQLQQGRGIIYVEVFNQISKAINTDSKTKLLVAQNIRWDELSEQVISRVSDVIIATVSNQHREVVGDIHTRLGELLSDVEKAMLTAQDTELEKLRELSLLNERLEKTQRELRTWRSLMNFRLSVQYLYFPALLFAAACIMAAAKFVSAIY